MTPDAGNHQACLTIFAIAGRDIFLHDHFGRTRRRFTGARCHVPREAVREAVRRTRAERLFHIDAWVVMPDHMHCVIRLPPGDADYSNRIKAIKMPIFGHLSRALSRTERRSEVRIIKGERGIWQRRFWEHAIRDEDDFAHCMDYVHFNPVKHGLVRSVADWPHSTFHRCAANGLYPADWGRQA